jgi:hypothetical protein
MTDEQTEILTLLYALGDAIRIKNWATALPIWERLLLMYSPLGDMQPHLHRVLRNEAAMIRMAERQTTKIH